MWSRVKVNNFLGDSCGLDEWLSVQNTDLSFQTEKVKHEVLNTWKFWSFGNVQIEERRETWDFFCRVRDSEAPSRWRVETKSSWRAHHHWGWDVGSRLMSWDLMGCSWWDVFRRGRFQRHVVRESMRCPCRNWSRDVSVRKTERELIDGRFEWE